MIFQLSKFQIQMSSMSLANIFHPMLILSGLQELHKTSFSIYSITLNAGKYLEFQNMSLPD